LKTSIQSSEDGGGIATLRLLDLAIHHHVHTYVQDNVQEDMQKDSQKLSYKRESKENELDEAFKVNKSTTRHLIFGREKISCTPLISISITADITTRRSLINGNINIASMQTILMPSFLSFLSEYIIHGAIMKEYIRILKMFPNDPDIQFPIDVSVLSISLENLIPPLFSATGGTFNIIYGGITLYMPAAYTPPNTDCPATQSGLENGGKGLDGVIVMSMGKGISVKAAWGEQCAFRGIEVVIMVKGISTSISGLSLVEPFDVCVQIVILPPTLKSM
jgi:hypothetical protein